MDPLTHGEGGRPESTRRAADRNPPTPPLGSGSGRFPLNPNAALCLGLAVLALGLTALHILMHRPVPHRITDWGPVAGLPTWLDSLLPDTLPFTRLALGMTLAALALAHLLLVRQLRGITPTRLTLPIIGISAPLLSMLPALAPHRFSGDVYAYIVYGRLSALHGANPMTTAPDSFPGDDFLRLMAPGYRDTPSVYGPAWNASSHVMTLLAEGLGGSVDVYVLLYRVVCLAGFLSSVWALWSLLGRWRPDAQVHGTVLYAWSPLTLLELGTIHNDFVMLGLVGLALVAASRGLHPLAITLLSTAVLVKWIAVVVLLAVTLQWSGHAITRSAAGRRLLIDGALFVGVAALLLAGFGDVVASLASPFNSEVDGVINSIAELGAVTMHQAAPLVGVTISTGAAVMIWEALSKALAIVILVLVSARAFRDPDLQSAVATAATGLLAITLVAPKLWPWYALWSLMLAPLAGRATRTVAVALSITSLLIYVLSPVAQGRTLWTAGLPVWVVAGALLTLLGSRFLDKAHRTAA